MKNRTPSSKFKNAVLVGVLGLMLGNAQAASVTQDVAFDFTNNLMPTGWDYFYLPYSPGTNVKIQNNQLEIGQVDTYGGIYTAFNPKDVTRLEVQYDGSISDVYWGEFTRALLLNNINDYFLTTGGFASSGMAKYGYGSNTTIFNIEGRTPDGVAATYASQVVNPAIFGTFHMDAVFQNGVISQTITRSDGSLVYSSGSVTAPGFSLANMNNIALFGATTTGASAVIDNVKISITRPPKTVGLFVGVQDTSPGKLTLPGDVTATNLYDDFEKKVGVGDLLVTNADIAGNTITKDEIYQHLKDLITNNNIGAGDKLVLYITGHGNSSVFPYDTGVGVDGINLGSTLTDAELYDVLTSLDPDGLIKKEVFLDSCHSGGFWGPPDQSEGTNKNLSSLKNIAVFTSAPESGFMYYNQNGGFFSQALDDAISAGIYNNATPSILNDFLFSDTFLKYPIQLGSQFFQGDFGDAVPADPNLFQFFYATSSDFNLNEPLGNGTVPEPATYTMLLAGLGLLGFMTRHRKNIAA